MVPLPIQFFLFLLPGWVNRQQLDVIEYLRAENRALREQLGGKRLRFTDAQRRRLARRAQPLGRRRLREISPIVTPDSYLGAGTSFTTAISCSRRHSKELSRVRVCVPSSSRGVARI